GNLSFQLGNLILRPGSGGGIGPARLVPGQDVEDRLLLLWCRAAAACFACRLLSHSSSPSVFRHAGKLRPAIPSIGLRTYAKVSPALRILATAGSPRRRSTRHWRSDSRRDARLRPAFGGFPPGNRAWRGPKE